jgi:hypothetical protein
MTAMDTDEAASKSAAPIGSLPAGFMMDGATYKKGAELGFEGVDFYVAGRGGALGDVCGDVVAASFVFFNPELVREAWERSGKVMGRTDAARAFVGCLAQWAEAHLPDGTDYPRLSELAGAVAHGCSPAGLALFAAWRQIAEPDEPKARALHRVNLLRELRGGVHGAAVVAQGLDPRAAVMVKTPFMAAMFGWQEPNPDRDLHRESWQKAEEATNSAMARHFSVLSPAERAELVDLVTEAEQQKTA